MDASTWIAVVSIVTAGFTIAIGSLGPAFAVELLQAPTRRSLIATYLLERTGTG